jgi:hypothetical protein
VPVLALASQHTKQADSPLLPRKRTQLI